MYSMKSGCASVMAKTASSGGSLATALAFVIMTLPCFHGSSCGAVGKGEALPDTRTWNFATVLLADGHSEYQREHLFIKAPGILDSLPLSNGPSFFPLASPDGRWLAYVAFNDSSRAGEVTTISRQQVRFRAMPGFTAACGDYKWSPDGQYLAGSVRRWTDTTQYFFVVRPESSQWWFADSLGYVGNYEFAWDPSSQRVAICRMFAHEDGETDFADGGELVVYDVRSRRTHMLASFADACLTAPSWGVGDSLRVRRAPLADQGREVELSFPVVAERK